MSKDMAYAIMDYLWSLGFNAVAVRRDDLTWAIMGATQY